MLESKKGRARPAHGLAAPSSFIGRRWLRSLVSLLLVAYLPPAAAESDVDLLLRASAPQLAVATHSAAEPIYAADAAAWTRWAHDQLALLRSQQRWAEALTVAKRVIEQGQPSTARLWGISRLAELQIAMADAEVARKELRTALWSGGADVATTREWRSLIVRAYLSEGRVTDAQIAWQRYEYDYGDTLTANEQALKAWVLWASGQSDAARAAATGKGLEARAVRQLLEWSDNSATLDTAAVVFRDANLPQPLRQPLLDAWLVTLTQQAAAAGIERLEAILAQPNIPAVTAALGEALWQSYGRYAEELANQRQLLMGDAQAWLSLARKSRPLQARALYAWLAQHGDDADVRARAQQNLLATLQNDRVVAALYLTPARADSIASLPEAIKPQLCDVALHTGALALARRLIDAAPADEAAWSLRRARLALAVGDVDAAEREAQQPLMQTALKHEPEGAGVVAVGLYRHGRYASADALLEAIAAQASELAQRREAWWWLAQSRQMQQQPLVAAQYYLRVAAPVGKIIDDALSALARHQAASLLAQAGMHEDAQAQYALAWPEKLGRPLLLWKEADGDAAR